MTEHPGEMRSLRRELILGLARTRLFKRHRLC
jgi:hypothetical protein